MEPQVFSAVDLINLNLFAFLLIFCRMGAALMFFPGVGEAFIPTRTRAAFALLFSLILTPVLQPLLPAMPADLGRFTVLIINELTIGFFIGFVIRIMILALDFAGQIIALQLGISTAIAFNPALATAGTLPGAIMGLAGILLIFATNLHHLLFEGLVLSYSALPAGQDLITASLSEGIVSTVSLSILVAVMITAPFIILGTIFNVGLGLLSRLQPQLQIFFVGLPLQIIIGMALFAILSGAMMGLWLDHTADSFARLGLVAE